MRYVLCAFLLAAMTAGALAAERCPPKAKPKPAAKPGKVAQSPGDAKDRRYAVPTTEDIQLTEADKSKTATAGVDKTIVLRLPGNKATGAWQITNLGGDSIQSVGKSQYVAGNPNGAFIFRFKAVKPGKTNLKLAYVRQGDKSTRPANTFTVDLVVRK